MTDIKRPIVLLSVLVFSLTVSTLLFPNTFAAILIASLILASFFFIFYFKKKRFAYSAFFVFVILFSVLHSYAEFTKGELYANKIAERYNSKEVLCTAKAVDCRHYSSYSVLFVEIQSIDSETLSTPVKARVSSYTAGSLEDGDIVKFSGKMTKVSDVECDGFDTVSYLRAKKTFLDFPSALIVSSSIGESDILSSAQKYAKSILYKYIPQGQSFDTSSVAHAIFSGDKDCTPSEIRESFKRSGIMHLLCVSGMHLTVVMSFFYACMSLLCVKKNIRCTISIFLCFAYAAFTGFSLSTVRSAIMCSLTFLSLMLARKTDGYISLFLALLLIVGISPYSVFDISLILSFCSCFGIILFSEMHLSFLKGKFLRGVESILLSNLGAVLFTLPIACYSFGYVSHFSLVSTFLASFACELLLICSLFLVLLSPICSLFNISPFLSKIGFVCDILCKYVIKTAKFFSSKKFAYTSIPKSTSFIFVILFVAVLALCVASTVFGIKRVRSFCIIFIIFLGVSISLTSLCKAIKDDADCKISYFRQNELDRQLSIKLSSLGYLIVNADNSICADPAKADFDVFDQNNYLLLIPTESTDPFVLSQSIRIFGERHGLREIYVPKTYDGALLAKALNEYDIYCKYMPNITSFDKTTVSFTSDGYQKITVYDEKATTTIVFAENYSKDYFDENCDICAFFTRNTKNQFNPEQDEKPNCKVFFTRMGKDDNVIGIENTYNKKTFIIKE